MTTLQLFVKNNRYLADFYATDYDSFCNKLDEFSLNVSRVFFRENGVVRCKLSVRKGDSEAVVGNYFGCSRNEAYEKAVESFFEKVSNL